MNVLVDDNQNKSLVNRRDEVLFAPTFSDSGYGEIGLSLGENNFGILLCFPQLRVAIFQSILRRYAFCVLFWLFAKWLPVSCFPNRQTLSIRHIVLLRLVLTYCHPCLSMGRSARCPRKRGHDSTLTLACIKGYRLSALVSLGWLSPMCKIQSTPDSDWGSSLLATTHFAFLLATRACRQSNTTIVTKFLWYGLLPTGIPSVSAGYANKKAPAVFRSSRPARAKCTLTKCLNVKTITRIIGLKTHIARKKSRKFAEI